MRKQNERVCEGVIDSILANRRWRVPKGKTQLLLDHGNHGHKSDAVLRGYRLHAQRRSGADHGNDSFKNVETVPIRGDGLCQRNTNRPRVHARAHYALNGTECRLSERTNSGARPSQPTTTPNDANTLAAQSTPGVQPLLATSESGRDLVQPRALASRRTTSPRPARVERVRRTLPAMLESTARRRPSALFTPSCSTVFRSASSPSHSTCNSPVRAGRRGNMSGCGRAPPKLGQPRYFSGGQNEWTQGRRISLSWPCEPVRWPRRGILHGVFRAAREESAVIDVAVWCFLEVRRVSQSLRARRRQLSKEYAASGRDF